MVVGKNMSEHQLRNYMKIGMRDEKKQKIFILKGKFRLNVLSKFKEPNYGIK